MLGFVFGTACLVGLVHVLRQGHCHSWLGPGWHGRGFGRAGGEHRRGWHEHGPKMMLRGLFEKLDTTPGQEKAILAGVEAFMQTAMEQHKELHNARSDVSKALRADSIDEGAMASARATVQTGMDNMQQAADRLLRTVHEALDAKQRAVLADMIDGHGGCGPWCGHPYRWM